jgi:hypothetical protein
MHQAGMSPFPFAVVSGVFPLAILSLAPGVYILFMFKPV